MDCFISRLKVTDNKLYGKRLLGKWHEILPSEIYQVKIYGWNNPYLKLWTKKGVFKIGGLRKEYVAVINFLELKTNFKLEHSLTNNHNYILYQFSIKDLVYRIFKLIKH